MGMDKLWQSKQRLEKLNAAENAVPAQENMTPGYRRTSGPRFEERHHRVTTYLENDLYRQLESLREQGHILNLTAFYNKAARECMEAITKRLEGESDCKPQKRTIRLPTKDPARQPED